MFGWARLLAELSPSDVDRGSPFARRGNVVDWPVALLGPVPFVVAGAGRDARPGSGWNSCGSLVDVRVCMLPFADLRPF